MHKGRPIDPALAARRRRTFLRALARHGNMRMAAEAANAPFMWFFRERARNPRFVEAIGRAARRAREALSGGNSPNAPNVAVWSRHNGRAKLVRLRTPGARWSRDDERTFLEMLRHSGNITMAAEAAGFAIGTIWQRRKHDPGFDITVRAALRAGYRHLLRLHIERCNAPVELPPALEEAEDMLAAMSNEAMFNQLMLHRSIKTGIPHPTPNPAKRRNRESVERELLSMIAALEDRDEGEAV